MVQQFIEQELLQLPAELPALSQVTNDTLDDQVLRYTNWMTAQAQRSSESIQQERMVYAKRASQIVEVDEQRIQTFAPFRYKYSALQTITPKQTLILGALGLILLLGCIWDWRVTSLSLLTLVSVIYLGHLFLDVVMAGSSIRHSVEEQIDDDVITALHDADWPVYTILCPLYHEALIVPQFVKAMRALDYPTKQLQIMFLTEADDTETRDAILALHLPPHFQIITVPDGSPRTKPRACNYGLMEAIGQYVVIYDAEDVPDPLQLKKAVLTFANHGVDLACVQAKLNFYNANQNLLTRWFTAEYSLWFDLILPGLQHMHLALPLGGTSNHFPTQTLRALGGWDAFNVTEDCDLGLRLSWFHLDTVVLNSTTYEEATSRPKSWIRQRSRWIKGYMQTYLVHMREPIHYFRSKRYLEFFSLQFVVGGKTLVMLLNPFMWALLLVSITLRINGIAAFSLPLPIIIISSISLLLGNFFYAYTYLLACMRRKEYHLVKWMLLIPAYWVMASIAAYMALYQLITKPHYWEKTTHGLHLQPSNDSTTPTIEMLLTEAEELSYVPLSLSPGTTLVRKYARLDAVPVASVEDTLQTMIAPRKPAFSAAERAALLQKHQSKRYDPWLLLTLFIACIASVAACHFYFLQHSLLSLTTSNYNIQLARSIVETGTITHLGNMTLPLPYLAMLPFVWNDALWHSGLAGSFPSMLCFVLTTYSLFLLARRLTHDSRASFVGSLLFILNPAILYFQSTPQNAIMAILTMVATCYFLLAWIQEDRLIDLLWSATFLCLATLSSYIAWALLIAILCFLPLIGLLKHQTKAHIESSTLVFGMLGGLGVVIWGLWCFTFTGSFFPLFSSFLHVTGSAYGIAAYHNLWQTLILSSHDAIALLGSLFTILSLLALLTFIVRVRLRPALLVPLALLVPFACLLLTVFSGQPVDTSTIPGMVFSTPFPSLLVELLPCISLLVATSISRKSSTIRAHRVTATLQIICTLLIVIQLVGSFIGIHMI
jgi:cellulose synthase/poly-beta-1,6-N-acetylglucosamine synthase-like glycosyltransferase